MALKSSQYNYIINKGSTYLFFNGITESFFEIPSERICVYTDIINIPDKYQDKFTDFIKKVKSKGFVIDDDTNELSLIKDKFNKKRYPEEYYLMVLPTYQCNLKCWYCLQHHRNSFIQSKTIKRLKKLIDKKLMDCSIKSLHLSWFGGEPLLAYDVIVELTRYANYKASKIGKQFSSAITTNGTLLTPERIETLWKAGITSYQITIDGDRPTHDSIKVLGKISAHDLTVGNVNLIAQHTNVILRYNYTSNNLNPQNIIESLSQRIDMQASKNIVFSMNKVWQESCESINKKDVDNLFYLSRKFGMTPRLNTFGLCYADHANFDCVFPNGTVGKCDNVMDDEAVGQLQDDGTIQWSKKALEYYQQSIFDNDGSPCIRCKYLPVCWGPCSAKRARTRLKNGIPECIFANRDLEMTQNILNRCKNLLHSS